MLRNLRDRFLVILFLISPTESYRFSELLEMHAVDTYGEFLESNEEVLRKLPAPAVAHEYYANFLYYFYEFQITGKMGASELRMRPQIRSLYDVFENIYLDEVSCRFPFRAGMSSRGLSPCRGASNSTVCELTQTRLPLLSRESRESTRKR